MSLIDDIKRDPMLVHLHDAHEITAALLAAEELAKAIEYISGEAYPLGGYEPPQVSMSRGAVVNAINALTAYRKATEDAQ